MQAQQKKVMKKCIIQALALNLRRYNIFSCFIENSAALFFYISVVIAALPRQDLTFFSFSTNDKNSASYAYIRRIERGIRFSSENPFLLRYQSVRAESPIQFVVKEGLGESYKRSICDRNALKEKCLRMI